MRILAVPNIDNPAALDAARCLADTLPGHGHEVLLTEADAAACAVRCESPWTPDAGPVDLVVALGGDGTILRAVHVLAGVDSPVLGINLGRLGFLAGVDDGDPVSSVLSALAGEGTEERRCTLNADLVLGGREAGSHEALNEVFIGRGAGARAVDVAVDVDGARLGRWVCDGLIVATPTGSTAYALSAGGPLIDPSLRGLLIVPADPHTLRARPVVVGASCTVSVSFPDPARADACVVVDGDVVPCRRAVERVDVRVGPTDVRLVRLQSRGFADSIRDAFF